MALRQINSDEIDRSAEPERGATLSAQFGNREQYEISGDYCGYTSKDGSKEELYSNGSHAARSNADLDLGQPIGDGFEDKAAQLGQTDAYGMSLMISKLEKGTPIDAKK